MGMPDFRSGNFSSLMTEASMTNKTPAGAKTTYGSGGKADRVSISYSDGSTRNYSRHEGTTVTQDKNSSNKETGHTTIHSDGSVHKHGSHSD
jgi:hypothetical protein